MVSVAKSFTEQHLHGVLITLSHCKAKIHKFFSIIIIVACTIYTQL